MKTLQQIDRTIDRPSAVYEEGRARRAALAAYAGPREVIAALRREPPLPYAERGAIVQALVAEHRASGRDLWTSLLLLSFEPMLERRRARIEGPARDRDLDEIVILSFLEAVHRYPLEAEAAFASHAIRIGTDEALYVNLRKGRRQLRAEEFDETRHGFGGSWERTGSAALREVERILARGGEDAEALTAMLEASATGQTLREWIGGRFPTRPRSKRAYVGVCRARRRVLAELRHRLDKASFAA